jgi:anti-anti-sigma factor
MSMTNAQVWQGSRFSVERIVADTPGEITFRFTGPFTVRDMHSSMSPVALRQVLDVTDIAQPTTHILDLSCVPYIDSGGLGLIVDHFSKCRKAGIRLLAIGAGPRVMGQFHITKIDTLFPICA